jgi:hypothetical protein
MIIDFSLSYLQNIKKIILKIIRLFHNYLCIKIVRIFYTLQFSYDSTQGIENTVLCLDHNNNIVEKMTITLEKSIIIQLLQSSITKFIAIF